MSTLLPVSPSVPISRSQYLAGVATAILGLFLYVLLALLSYKTAHSMQHFWVALLLLNVGVTMGWLLGVLASPDTAEEESRFARYSKFLGTLLTGYVLSKIDWDKLLSEEFWTELRLVRALLWLTGLLVAALVTYTLREYVLPSPTRAPSKPTTS